MTLNEYQEQAKRNFAGERATITNAVLGMAGEAGEIADYVKKCRYQGHKYDSEVMKEELGDLLFYVANAARICGFTLKEVAEYNNQKLWGRYPNCFDIQRSIHRC